ncbi:MAG: 3-demethylubiquinone-9 3-methyltransferase [uncultured bacterium (gcode 4)]|uniref:3-demethylubiquinone-9 3-methyltransferase n=1 Tax=uncultured bacterium (gcode 4) TaxID=1234023 RepID=K2FXM3_9BACT|nr:MAG: 3-demethylubiquinone-9 3-methyltransferase [uncultured bacterium (gcode 4)]
MQTIENRQKITPFLWFDDNAEEAVNFYASLFNDSGILTISRYWDEMPEMKWKILTVVFELGWQKFMAIDWWPFFKFTEAISLFVDCDSQEEVDSLWERLSEGWEKGQCWWLKDKFGLSWQIVPHILGELMQDPDPEKTTRVMKAVMKMNKLESEVLKLAYDDKL